MRALVFHGPHEIAVEELPTPSPGKGEVLIDVLATGICGSDIHGYTGENGRRSAGQVMGHETVGRVAQLGDADPSALHVGDLVTVNPVISCGTCADCVAKSSRICPNRRIIGVQADIVAAFAEQMVVPANNVVALPSTIPWQVGALVEPLAVGFRAASRGSVTEGDAVLVLGGGPIGQAAALAARRLGGHVLVSEVSARRREIVAALGFTVIDPTAGQLGEQAVQELGERPTVVIDAVGLSATILDALRVSAFGATIVLVGMGQRLLEVEAFRVSTEERTIVGSFCYTAEQFESTAAWVAQNAEMLSPLIDKTVSLAEAPAIFAELAQGTDGTSKVLVLLDSAHANQDLTAAPI